MNFSVVITTVFHPKILEILARNIQCYSRKKEVEILVVGDLKTPPETKEYVEQFAKCGFNFEYWDVTDQQNWLRRFPDLENIIPYNSDNRRNIGYLIAYERRRECIIALDDDNYPLEADYFAGHEKVGKRREHLTIRTNTGWYNVCELLKIQDDIRIYPRGYPYANRRPSNENYEWFESDGRVIVNAGLWLGDPDVDAVTRLNGPVNVTGLKNEVVMLDRSTQCPFNTQNTAFHRDVLPSYYYVVMGYSLGGLKIDRYGDIWSSYLSRKIIDRMNDRVAFGTPLAMHKRRSHNLLKDLGQEYWGMILTNRLVELLAQIDLRKDSYGDCYRELANKLEEKVCVQEDLSNEVKLYFQQICKNMRIWVDVCSAL